MHFHELARAKINLTLNVLGRRADGYHDIESLVTFADIGDRITLDLGTGPKVSASGPFAGAIEGENLLETTLRLVHEGYPEVRLGAVALEKNLPVAAGLGGGSADAAALLRALRHANKERSASIDWGALARRLGADVAVCLAGVPAVMHGIGDIVDPLDEALRPPVLAAVLINPRVPLPTAEVFSALALPASARTASGRPPAPPDVKDAAALVDYMRARGNDLESA
ncbi:MAG TPA: 4-(cytidine 5'-diphospho)-2-C-methyl-D-erythritol kinase, partial [Hyphomicrobiaceae bacterium]|nr:4-(cytidine 5'-diphospho)-2-C-methyl-D-erythritol kinase [Hyphomicrobiaceae bacterium]